MRVDRGRANLRDAGWPLNEDQILIVGGGFSGTLLAINLLRQSGPRVTIVEREDDVGGGVAFGAAHPAHVLNVRASNMSAFPDDPQHFVRWLEAQGGDDASHAFVPRLIYGRYLRTLLEEARQSSGSRLTLIRGEVDDVCGPPICGVRLTNGQWLAADKIILALGNLPPHTPLGVTISPPDTPRYIADPWHISRIRHDGAVLIMGTGLTMVDVALRLEAEGFEGRIYAMSRRGLLPRPHISGSDWERRSDQPNSNAVSLLREVRARASVVGWRNAVDELRPFNQAIWRNAPAAEKARFLRHLRPWWDVHRHRLAPQVAEQVQAMVDTGKLTIMSGKLKSVEDSGAGITVRWRARGEGTAQHLAVAQVINCTGPQGDLSRTENSLLRRLVEDGQIRADACRIGIDVDQVSRTVSEAGQSNDWLLATGPMTRGAFWEIVAVPDIRLQASSLAASLAGAETTLG